MIVGNAIVSSVSVASCADVDPDIPEIHVLKENMFDMSVDF